jgi:cobalamin biosynthesis protein CobT
MRKYVKGTSGHAMEGDDRLEDARVYQAFKAAVVLAEVLERVKVPYEISGFNTLLYSYKDYGEHLSPQLREHMSTMLQEVFSYGAAGNNDGWAVREASNRLAAQTATEKYLIVLSDGEPAPSHEYAGPQYELETVVQSIIDDTNQIPIGLGIQSHAVENFYPIAIVEDDVPQLAAKLAELIQDIINNPTKYKVR